MKTIQPNIQRSFSDAAKQYAAQSQLQQQIADELLATMPQGFLKILDVGCGTGYLTAKLKIHNPQARITGLDFAPGMLKQASRQHPDIVWVLGDSGQLPFSDGDFDLVVSNAAYQWVMDLTQAFGEARRVLHTNGVFVASFFGFHTCTELFEVLQEAKGGALRFTRLADQSQVMYALTRSGFKNIKIGTRQEKKNFRGMPELLAWLKAIGANHLPREGYIGKETLARAAAMYAKRFSASDGVYATFEVIQVYANV